MEKATLPVWRPTSEELDEIMAEMGPIIQAFAQRDRATVELAPRP